MKPLPTRVIIRRETPLRRTSLCAGLLGLGALHACAPVAQVEVVPVSVDVEQESLRTELATRIEQPVRITFDWRVQESGLRLSGSGLARVEPPYRSRLDLFLGNGERAAVAALVGGEMRLPPGMASQILPPPHLLWGAMGVFRPGIDVALLGGETVDDLLRLRYRLENDDEIHYWLDGRQLMRVDLLRGGDVVQDLRLTRDESAVPTEAVYRDLTAFRQLTLTRRGVENVEPYPPDIWSPGMGGDRPDPDSDARDDGV